MRFAFWVLIALIVCLLIGAFMASSDAHYSDIKEMSNHLIIDWLIQKSSQNTWVLLWFISLCIIGVLLAISFVFCSYYNLLKVARKQATKHSYLLLFVHIMFILIMALHLASMVFGYKYSNVKLMVNDSFCFEDEYCLKLDSVNYVDDVNILKMKFMKMREFQTRELFHYKENKAFVTLYKNGQEVHKGEASILSPFSYGSLRMSISFFYLPPDSDSTTPGIKVVIMKNDLVELFFISYIIGIISILWFLLLSWKRK